MCACANRSQYKRYEILGAFFNAVFLIALCITIALEALPRLFNPPVIENAALILYVGCAGLASNLVGFFVLGGFGHGHSHDDHEGHDHSHDDLHNAEEGHSHHRASVDSGKITHVPIPEHSNSHINFIKADEEEQTRAGTPPQSSRPPLSKSPASKRSHTRTTSSGRYEGYEAISDLSLHPSRFREGIIAAANRLPLDGIDSEEGTESESEETVITSNEESPLIQKTGGSKSTKISSATYVKQRGHSHDHSDDHRPRHATKLRHANHNHNKPQKKKSDSHGHNHADMGMNAMILHVAGDALGNVGVIVSALVIWLTTWAYRYYVDPLVSLFIAMIILKSCIPLSKASGKILCQATPDHIKLSDIKEDLQDIDGVVNCHHVHVWQLSDSTIVASLHLRVSFGRAVAKDEATYMAKYMQTANDVQECLHAYGIHSSTIQPEFCWDNEDGTCPEFGLILDGPMSRKATGTPPGGDDCILGECVADCEAEGCCVPTSIRGSRNASIHSHDSHSHQSS